MQAAAWGFNTDDSEAFRDEGRSLDFRELQLFWGGTISFCCHLVGTRMDIRDSGWIMTSSRPVFLLYHWGASTTVATDVVSFLFLWRGWLMLFVEPLQVKYSRSSLKPHCGRLYSWNVPPDSLSTSVCLWVPGFHQSSSRMWTHASVVSHLSDTVAGVGHVASAARALLIARADSVCWQGVKSAQEAVMTRRFDPEVFPTETITRTDWDFGFSIMFVWQLETWWCMFIWICPGMDGSQIRTELQIRLFFNNVNEWNSCPERGLEREILGTNQWHHASKSSAVGREFW